MIAIIFLVLGILLTVWIISYRDVVLSPLAQDQLLLMEAMSCDELIEYSSTGYFWSADNAKWIREHTDACKSAAQ